MVDIHPIPFLSLSPGDAIHSVNGHSVNLENIDSVLAGLSNEVCRINIIISYSP